MPYALIVCGLVLAADGIARPVPIFLLWGPGVALVLLGWFWLEHRTASRRRREHRRGGWIL